LEKFDLNVPTIQEVEGILSYRFQDHPSLSSFPLLIKDLENRIQSSSPSTVRIVVGEGTNFDTVFFLFIKKVEEICRLHKVSLECIIEEEKNRQLAEILNRYRFYQKEKDTGYQPPPEKGQLVVRLGDSFLNTLSRWKEAGRFIVDYLRAFLKSVFNPRIIRWRELAFTIEQAGSRAMPIVGIMSFLIGLVTAFQAAVQLRQFGANIFVADLAALGLSRELSPLITAVLMAGRTTSAFAAEIGIMNINEELDALKVMNVNVTHFLIIPRITGALLSSPLLTVWSFFTGLLGAMFVAFVSLDVTPTSFMTEAYGILGMSDLWVGFLKSIFFGIIVGSVGCYMGIKTSHSPESVGRQTTAAVVAALFMIIIADAFVTVLANVFKW
jgi:phospholipid/cholesterol/gamma-HCH transport system permease protein